MRRLLIVGVLGATVVVVRAVEFRRHDREAPQPPALDQRRARRSRAPGAPIVHCQPWNDIFHTVTDG
jgi:hypothetical protein